MNFYNFLSADTIRIADNGIINSRKKVLEILSEILANTNRNTDAYTVFQYLVEREKLSSTALGNGIAIPHCRISNIEEPQAALLRISPGIDYDAPDQVPVTMFFALLVPESAIEAHLKILANLAKILNNKDTRQHLEQSMDTQQILSILKSATPNE